MKTQHNSKKYLENATLLVVIKIKIKVRTFTHRNIYCCDSYWPVPDLQVRPLLRRSRGRRRSTRLPECIDDRDTC
jgi:hypothetical protein